MDGRLTNRWQTLAPALWVLTTVAAGLGLGATTAMAGGALRGTGATTVSVST